MRSRSDRGGPTSLEAEGRGVVERLGGAWGRDGGMCLCPAHDDGTPSLSVRPGARRLLFHCFAGCDRSKVIQALNALRLLGAGPARVDRADRGPRSDDRHRALANGLWAGARPLGRSPARLYLMGRGLMRMAADLRYHPRTPYGRGAAAIFRPAMLAAVRDEAGLVGIHRTYLDADAGTLADLPIARRALGRLGQGAVRLNPPRDGLLGLAEGIETALAATELFDIPCWATLGTERFARVSLPPGTIRLILFLDNDAGGRRAETLARGAHDSSIGIEARYPKRRGDDWNDVLRARLRVA